MTVTKATLTVTADDKSKVYGASNPTLTYSYTGFVNGDDAGDLTGTPTVSTLADSTSAVNTYTITTSLNTLASNNYSFSLVNGTLTVTKATLTVTADDKSKVYGDDNPTLTYAYTGFVNGDDAGDLTGTPTVSTLANSTSPVNTYTITTSLNTLASDNYSFSLVNGTLTVTKATLTVTADDQSKTYGDDNPTLTYTFDGFVNSEDESVLSGEPTISTLADSTSGAGTYDITTSLNTLEADNYSFSLVDGTLTVTKATLTVTADDKSKVYGAITPSLTYSYTGFVNGDDAGDLTGAPTVSTLADSTSPVNTYSITTSLNTLASSNYSFNLVNGTLTVTKATLTVTADDKSKVYGASNPSLTYSYTGFVNGDDAGDLTGAPSVSTSADSTSAVNTYTITTSLNTLASSNYSFNLVNGILTVTKAMLTVTADDKSKIYGSANPTFTYTVNNAQLVNGDSASVVTGAATYSTTATTSSPTTASYPITITGGLNATNYTLVLASGSLTVTKATLTVTASDKSKVYATTNPTFTYSFSGFVSGDSESVISGIPSFSTLATTGSSIGNYAISITQNTLSATNYTFSMQNGNLAITKAPLTVIAENKSKVYGSSNPTLTYVFSGFVNGDLSNVVTGSPSLVTTAITSSDVGSYPITITPGDLLTTNYSFVMQNADLTITKADQSLTFTALEDKVYGAETFTLNATSTSGLTVTFSVLSGNATISGNQVSITGVGAVVIAANQSGNGNYNAASQSTRTFHISKAPLTFTAQNKTIFFDDPLVLPTLTYTVEGFVYGEDESILSGEPALSSTATTASDVGLYPISISTGTLIADNYTFDFESAVLNISNGSQVITFPVISDKIYNSGVITFDAQASSELPVIYTVLSGNATISGNQLSVQGSGAITIAADQAGDLNYLAAPRVSRSFICFPETPTISTAVDRKDEYLFITDRTFYVSWSQSTDTNLDRYELIRDGVLTRTYAPTETLVFDDHNKKPNSTNTYVVKSFNQEGHESAEVTVHLP